MGVDGLVTPGPCARARGQCTKIREKRGRVLAKMLRPAEGQSTTNCAAASDSKARFQPRNASCCRCTTKYAGELCCGGLAFFGVVCSSSQDWFFVMRPYHPP